MIVIITMIMIMILIIMAIKSEFHAREPTSLSMTTITFRDLNTITYN